MLFNIERLIFKIEAIIISVALFFMFLAVIIQVFVRITGQSSIGTTEIGMLGMSVLTFIGTSAIVYTKDQITIELTQVLKSRKLIFWLDVLVSSTMIVFGVVFIRIVYIFFDFTRVSGEKTLELGIPLTISAGAMLIGIGLLIFHSFCDLVRLFKKKSSLTGNNEMEGN